ncbi:MAG: ECF transporter S component [Clostridiales bacterium]|nr:ECF transporter S component [Clostridiales bacterium]
MKLDLKPLRRMIYIAMLAAIAMVIMHMGFSIIPAASYLKYEPSGAVILLSGLLLGPGAAAECALVKCVLYFFTHGGSPYGHLSDLIAMLSFSCTVSGLFHHFGVKQIRRLALCCVAGCAVVTLVMIPANYVILHLQYGMTPAAVSATMIYVIPYNLLKSGLNSVIAVALYPRVESSLRKLSGKGE